MIARCIIIFVRSNWNLPWYEDVSVTLLPVHKVPKSEILVTSSLISLLQNLKKFQQTLHAFIFLVFLYYVSLSNATLRNTWFWITKSYTNVPIKQIMRTSFLLQIHSLDRMGFSCIAGFGIDHMLNLAAYILTYLPVTWLVGHVLLLSCISKLQSSTNIWWYVETNCPRKMW